jgi:flagellar motor switch protein FliM
MEPCGIEVLPASRVFERIPETAIHFRTPLESSSELTLLVASRPLLVAVLGGLLGSPPESAADLDLELTPVEEEMAEFVVEHFFLAPLQQVWPLAEKLSLSAPRRQAPAADPPYLPTALLVVVQFRAKGEFGEFDWWWILPRNGWLATLIGNSTVTPGREAREAAVRELPVRLTVQLGSARLSLLHLAALQVGDLLILDQPINQALPALLGGHKKFLVWPGACGARQAISIHAPVES